jgi:hypothetical protein
MMASTYNVELAELKLPDLGLPTIEPAVPAETFAARMENARQRTAEAGLNALLVYGDREHAANLAYLTNYDPRFEEALLILIPEREPVILVGNEGVSYTTMIPIPVQTILYQPFSLISQPRDSSDTLARILKVAGITGNMRVGLAGWKYFTSAEADVPDRWLETPSYLVDTLRALGCDVRNASALFMHPETGMRSVNDVDQLAVFEYNSTITSQGIRDMLAAVQPGMAEYELVQAMRWGGIPLVYHPVVMSGERTRFGLASPSSRRIKEGDPIFAALGVLGTNTARGGFLVKDESGLPDGVHDYVEKLVTPYFRAVVEWYKIVGVDVSGGELYDLVHEYVGDPFFGVTLNPGHLVHLDEWLSSPIYKGSTEQLRSGMLIQVDVIPATGTTYFTTNIEDTIALADETLRASFQQKYPEAWARIEKRRAFMHDALGIQLKPDVLPFSNMPAWLPPYWLSPGKAMRATG